ncbi:MAG TPA: hypothetical protein PKY82_31795, partial [Pyrinomonadaceae bacterium]|nr:hypothetical protein [Pyrinomonadaceae bacterium]
LFIGLLGLIACEPPMSNSNSAAVNSNVKSNINSNSNSTTMANSNVVNSSPIVVETKEPEQYQAKINLKFEANGEQQKTALPTITTNFARNGQERRMEFSLPNNEKVIYLNKAESNYLILPNRKQYAILDKESLGIEIRQMMLPSEIINRVKAAPGVEKVGEESYNGKQVIRYRYGAKTNTQTNAGQVNTESAFLVDKETGLPLYSETVSSSQNGNVQGYSNLRIITEMSDVSMNVTPELFAVPADYQKIDAEQVKAQANLIFNTVALLLNQMMKSNTTNSNSNSNSNSNMTKPMPSPSANK